MKNKMVIQIAIIGILAIVLVFTLGNSEDVKLVDSEEFEKIIQSEEVFMINAHTPYIGEISGTDLIAENWEDMAFYQDKLPDDKSTPIALYCRSGRMSAISAQELVDLGYTTIYDLEGGMNAWQSSGRKILDKRELSGETKEFNIIAKNWEFSPGIIEVNQGDSVLLHVKSIDTFHGIALTDFGINKQLPPGETIDIEFIADKKGTFNFFCSVPCGHGHSSMGGQLVVS